MFRRLWRKIENRRFQKKDWKKKTKTVSDFKPQLLLEQEEKKKNVNDIGNEVRYVPPSLVLVRSGSVDMIEKKELSFDKFSVASVKSNQKEKKRSNDTTQNMKANI